MLAFQNFLIEYAWYMNGLGVVLVLVTRWTSNTVGIWACTGCILLVIAVGNAWLLITAGLNPSQTMPTLFGLLVLGSLGVRFVGNWLTAGAT